ncbi:UNVERIFIED_CONTAM: hypothetical protein RMT77_009894 [Armadillidium vulgare]
MPNITSLEESVKSLSNDELFQKLSEHNVSVGPIVASTRRVYEKKLIILMGGTVPDSSYSGTVDEEEYSDPQISNGNEYVSEKRTTNYSTSKGSSSPTLRSRATTSSNAKTWNRTLEDSLAFDHDRHTPSPRPSLRTVTSSTTTSTSTKYISPSGNIRETRTLRETYTPLSKGSEGPDEGKTQVTRFLVKCFFILVLVAVLYITYQSISSDSPFEGLEKMAKDALNSANKEIRKDGKKV